MSAQRLLSLRLAVAVLSLWTACAASAAAKKIVIVAGVKSHGPEGNRVHDYPWSAKLIKASLEASNVKDAVRVEVVRDGWPKDPAVLADADTVMVISDGRDGDKYSEAPYLESPERVAEVQNFIDRGCGFVTFHFSTFAPDKYAKQVLDWTGGYFDWEENGERKWYSAIKTLEADVIPLSPHPITTGVRPFRMKEEFYYNIRFEQDEEAGSPKRFASVHPEPAVWIGGSGLTCSHLQVSGLEARNDWGRTVAWSRERKSGGRGFGTTCGHYYDNWKHDDFRKLILNALVWTAHVDVPKAGVDGPYLSRAAIAAALNEPFDSKSAGEDADGNVIPPEKKTSSRNAPSPATDSLRERGVAVGEEPAERSDLSLVKGQLSLAIANHDGAYSLPLIRPSATLSPHSDLRADEGCPAGRRLEPDARQRLSGASSAALRPAPATPSIRLVSQKKSKDDAPKPDADAPIRVLLFAGNDAHKWHNWEKTTPIIKKLLEIDPRITVDISNNIEDLATKLPPGPDGKRPYDVVVQNYVNWHDNTPLSAASKSAFIDFVDNGGGLILVHFANGAFHYSLPEAGDTDWPEYRKLVRRVWNHSGPEQKRSAHDAFKPMSVRPTKVKHDITKGLASFKITDELYFSQVGDEAIEPLITAKSSITKVDEPLAFAYDFGKGRVFQTLLGHSEQTYDAFEPREMLRRAAAWSAHREVHPTPLEKDTSVTKKKENHWGTDQVGFEWTERDSEDDRWKNSEIGNFLASIVPFGTNAIAKQVQEEQFAEKGLTIKVGEKGEGAVCYDTARGQMRAAWTGGFLKFHPRRYGIIEAPHPDGTPMFVSSKHMGFASGQGEQPAFHYRGLWRRGSQTVLNWEVGETSVQESPWIATIHDQTVLIRTFRVAPGDKPVAITLLKNGPTFRTLKIADASVIASQDDGPTPVFAIKADRPASLRAIDGMKTVQLEFPARTQPVELTLFVWSTSSGNDQQLATVAGGLGDFKTSVLKTDPGPAQWTKPIVTNGTLGSDSGPYTVDTVTIPFENPYKAMFFVTGHDFLTPDIAAICTVHGDIWLVSGLAGDWKELKWKRYATGLFQPLGLVVRKRLSPPPAEAANAKPSLTSPFDIIVICRDHLARLHDLNADDEADYYEVFNEDVLTSSGGHDYVTCLETDNIGRLYYLHALEGVVRISPDGKYKEIVGTGYRNPNGLGVSPDGDITVAPQEGNWTPSSGIFEVHPGSYGGFGGPKVQSGRPLGYDPPLCWIPRRLDNSSGGQVWVTSDKWGPLEGKLLHLSYGQCTIHLVLREDIHGQGQGGTVKLTPTFESGVCRGRFSPFDGQLYVSGLRGWTTSATQDGCFQRMRYTGKPVHLPTGVGTLKNGLTLTFSQPLDRDSAEDPDNYFAEAWNITYRKDYGSPEFKISNPKEEGRDPVDVVSATLLEDGRTVFLEIPDIQPVAQLSLSYTLNAKDGTKLDQTYVHTIHQVRDAPFDPSKITRRAPKGQLSAEEEKNLRPGVQWWFSDEPFAASGSLQDSKGAQHGSLAVRTSRLAALRVNDNESPTGDSFNSRPFFGRCTGLIHSPLKKEVRLSLAGAGIASLIVNGETVINASAIDSERSVPVGLHKGYNRFQVNYTSPAKGTADLRLLWTTDSGISESVSPDALFATDEHGAQQEFFVRQGHLLIDSLHCANCHTGASPSSIPLRQAPSLENAGSRMTPGWIASWILDPKAHRRDATMPAMLSGLPEIERPVVAADIAAYLASLGGQTVSTTPDPTEPAAVKRGNQFWEDLGCIVCHRLTPNTEEPNDKRQSLTEVASKFTPGSLKAFITNPQKHFPTTYMPNFRLSEKEADDLSAFLLSRRKREAASRGPAGRVKLGEEFFGTLGCRQCHVTKADEAARTPYFALTQGIGNRGCLSAKPSTAKAAKSLAAIPDFQLTDEQKTLIELAWPRPQFHSAAEESRRLMKAMHCQACHDRDGVKSTRMQVIVEESESGFPPEQLPALTWTGERLRQDWMESFIAGKVEKKPREWLKARMPAFPAYAQAIAAGIVAEHGLDGSPPPQTPVNDELAAAGKDLIAAGGLDCRQCHGLGDLKPTGDKQTLLAPGINFSMVKDRIQPEFYHRWMLDPPRYDTNTRMPKLAPDGKKTKVTKFFDGDAQKQFDAIWEYLKQP